MRELTTTLLKAIGYSTVTAADASSALEILIARDDIAMVMTDVVMPGPMDGFELANRCRGLRADLPIMLVSGHPLDDRVAEDQAQWADRMLQKPYRTTELAMFVSQMLSKSSPAPAKAV